MKIVVISNSTNIENETEVLIKLFEAGLECFHLRKTKMSTRKMSEYLKKIPKHFHNRITIHSHFNLALRYNLKGIYLTAKHKKSKLKTMFWVRSIKVRKPKIEISTSFKNLSLLYNPGEKIKYSYVFLSPVFDSHTGKFQSGFSEYSLKVALKKVEQKVVARGGVSIDNIERAHKIGFAGVAFYTSIWRAKDPVEEFNRIVEKFKELDIPTD